MQDKDIIIINDYIENDPLSENNFDKTLELVNEIRLSCLQKSIWLYTGYTINEIFPIGLDDNKRMENIIKRQQIIKQCDMLVDGRYIDSQRNLTLPWVGSSNQRVIKIPKSLQKGEIVLWQT